jgi:hypothetical protein
MEQFLSEGLWEEIRRVTKSSRRVYAAIAYIHEVSHMMLSPGDVLVCDASYAAVAGGQTSVTALKSLARKNVKLYSVAGLHAKVLVADDTVFIGSGNASRNSIHESLIEAGLRSSSPTILAGALAFIHKLVDSPEASELTRSRLRTLSKIKVTRRSMAARRMPARKGRLRIAKSRFWIANVVELKDKEAAREAVAVKRASKRIKEEFGVTDPAWVRWDGKDRIRRELQAGSRIIVLHKPKDRALPDEVFPPSAILRREESTNGSSTLFFYDPELSTPMKSIGWKTFKALVRKSGLRRTITSNSVVEISGTVMDELDRLWPRSRKARKRS